MVTALVGQPDVLCLHLDRCRIDTQTAQIFKCNSALQTHADCLIPTFVDDQLQTRPLEYTIVALQSHFGGLGSGHYRTALRVQPTAVSADPVEWLLCDDHQTPKPIWELPSWFSESTALAWLVRTDKVLLHQYAHLPPSSEVVQDMLNLLRNCSPLSASTEAAPVG